MFVTMRVLVGIGSLLLLLIGLLLLVIAGAPGGVGAVWFLALGGVGLISVAFERSRYRSEASEQSWDSVHAAGVDDGPPDPRFTPTDERFVDPTTRRQLRVWMDRATGERRYRLDE